MEQVSFKDISTEYQLCIPGLPSVRIDIIEVFCTDDGIWTIESSHGTMTTKEATRKVWATKKC